MAQIRWPFDRTSTIVAAIGVALVAAIAVLLTTRELELQRTRLNETAESHFLAFDRVHQSRLLYQHGLNSFFASSSHVSLDQLYDHLLATHPDRPLNGAIAYAPVVRHAGRSGFEGNIRDELRMGFRIWDYSAGGVPRAAPRRTRYLPVTHVWPLTGNEAVLGYELWSDAALRSAMERAVASGGAARSDAVPLMVDRNRRLGYFVFLPLYSKGPAPTTEKVRWQRLEGFTVGVYRFGAAVEQTLHEAAADVHSVYVYNSRLPAALPVYRYEPDARFEAGTDAPRAINLSVVSALAGAWTADAEVAGKALTYVMVPVRPATWWSAFGASSLRVVLLALPFIALLAFFLQRRARGAASLHRTDHIHHAIIESSLDVYVLLDDHGNILEWNPRAERLFGWTAQSVVGTPLSTVLMSPDQGTDHRVLDQLLERATRESVGVAHETTALSREGAVLHLEMAINPARLPEGLRFVTFIRDISDRREREQELEQLSLLASKTTNAITILDAAGRMTWINDCFAEAFGCRAEDARGRPVHELLAERATPAEQIAALSRSLQARQGSRQEIEVSSPSGAQLWFELDLTPVLDHDGTLSQTIVIGTDISNRKRTERHLVRAQKLEAIGQAMGGLAHDFNNLLGIIVGNLDLLALQAGDDTPRRQKLDTALDAALRAGQLTKSLLSVARRQVLAPTRTDLGTLMRDLLPVCRQTAGPGVNVVLTVGTGPVVAGVDESGLQTALLNLVMNAREAMPAGGRLGINVERRDGSAADGEDVALTAGTYVVIEVTDTGGGMTPDVAARAFEPFFTTKDRGRGAGLGLATVYGFARQSGGAATLATEPGRGTTVRMYLPAQPARELAAAPAKVEDALPRGKERILVVDDEPALLDLAGHWLSDLGYDVQIAPSPTDAAKLLRSDTRFDLLFTDIVMPGGTDGIALALSAKEERPEMKVAFMSGFPDSMMNPEARALPGPLLAKPYRRAELARMVRALLDANPQRRPS